MTDLSGVYQNLAGIGSKVAAQMAVESRGGKLLGAPIEIVIGDFGTDNDKALETIRRWYVEEGVDIVLDLPNSALALRVADLARTLNKIHINTAGATSDLTGKACGPNHVHWTYDSWSTTHGNAQPIVRSGGDSWFYLTVDYALGHALERDSTQVVQAAGGRVLGGVRHPLGNGNFRPQVEAARDSGARIVALASSGMDAQNAVRAAGAVGLWRTGQRLAGMLMFVSDVHALGLQASQGLLLTESFYWDLNDDTRAFSAAFAARHGGAKPTMVQAGIYSALLHYFKAVEAAGGDGDGARIVQLMKDIPTDDPLFGKGQVRADGRKIHDMYVFEVKPPRQSSQAWDYYKLLQIIPGEQAFRPLSENACPMLANAPNK